MSTVRKGDDQFAEAKSTAQELIILVAAFTAPDSNKNASLNDKYMLEDACMQPASIESIGGESLFYCLPA